MTTPNLQAFAPADIALVAVRRFYTPTLRLVRLFAPVLSNPDAEELTDLQALQTVLGQAMVSLTGFAQSGWEAGVPVEEARASLAYVLPFYESVADQWEKEPPSRLSPFVDDESDVGLVINCALGRIRLFEEQPLVLDRVAQLAGMSYELVYADLKRLYPQEEVHMLAASRAVLWLASKGVKGF